MASIVYVHSVDSRDVITGANDAWVRFAAENGDPELPVRAIGSSLWKFIAGLDVAHIYQNLIVKVRTTGRSVSVPFRCDTPLAKRFMRLEIRLAAAGALDFSSVVERAEPFAQPIALLDPASPRDAGMPIRMCSWCKRVDVEGSWQEVDIAVERLALFGRETIPRITHGICEQCDAMLQGED